MKWMIASDIHGSARYAAQLLDAFSCEQADRLLLLGDILYHGPRNDLPDGYAPKEVIAALNPLADRIRCVRGNCDAEVDQMVLDFPMTADYALLEASGVSLFATHGHRFSPDAPPPVAKGTVVLFGHTHIPVCVQKDGVTYLNPGSVSIPKNGSRRGYLLFDGRTFVQKTLEGEELSRVSVG